MPNQPTAKPKPLSLEQYASERKLPKEWLAKTFGLKDAFHDGVACIEQPYFASALADLDDAYANSPKCAWLMNKKTLANVAGIVTKYGQPLDLVKYVEGQPFILGIPVKTCPSMDNVGNGKNPVVLGDLSYWATRLVADPLSGIQVINEAPGLVENGKVGLACFFRADGELLYNDTSSPAPFVVIQTHS